MVTGTGPFTYQWQKNNANISGATSVNLHDARNGFRRQWRVRFAWSSPTRAGSATSNSATLTVDAAPVAPEHHDATSEPDRDRRTDGDVFRGGDRDRAVNYQWQKNNANISGATSSTLHDARNRFRRQWRHVSRDRHQLGRHSDEQFGNLDRNAASGWRRASRRSPPTRR